ncbi:MAG: hypothetical protein A2887_05545 [Alphaproteobacteria bacterium RIFCSPLOWO2_01_FULL_40_26]|nr:MAG: hypothetical protein A3D15_06000 [Alphaproteobacteria bacterium RIFCSPHIGHO2_02_FULL_40_34]OFW94196.1 MAG: hypothetical protein A2887_05545 [Alphaproteobacteria bacterium RIFCSPLOWO2_01_FULL_40_26]OFX09765.1 MAG: hypothetical protein A3H30_00305 [Alphaproteobacteria bacterium RIFCSPLOWO2_02_FULL_40_19]OFX12240.1 MAG: hypothetical protein A3G22_01815 [Alphaproteobacteria bacterium RIFCSPLOWO2_12_FULL_40_11]
MKKNNPTNLPTNLVLNSVLAISICAVAIFIVLKAPQILDKREIREFNRDLKNYNVKLQILTDEKEIAEFKVVIADNDYKKMYGLMNLDDLPSSHGMLFPFATSRIVGMWMKNTRIPLDMIFIDADNEIASIATDTIPYSLAIISSQKEVKSVLEINAGLTKKLGIRVGQRVRILN